MTFLGLLTLLFVGLKLTGYIAWSWWLVLLPLYGGTAFVGGLLVIGSAIAFTLNLFSKDRRRSSRCSRL